MRKQTSNLLKRMSRKQVALINKARVEGGNQPLPWEDHVALVNRLYKRAKQMWNDTPHHLRTKSRKAMEASLERSSDVQIRDEVPSGDEGPPSTD